MPTTHEILAGLTAIANDAVVLAILWHLAIGTALVWIATGWLPRRGVATGLLAAPLVSAATLAVAYANPFNGLVLGAGALALVLLALRAGDDHVEAGPRWATTLGVAMIAFAWAYPHFLETGSSLAYLFAAPVGLVPCPSIALAIGFALLGGGIDRRAAGVLAGLGFLYGIIGVFRFGVMLDVGLLGGAAGLAALVIHPRARLAGVTA